MRALLGRPPALLGRRRPPAPTVPPPAHAGPLVVAHRGASGYRPEHTLEAYRLAIELGADFIEPDLVITADGVLVARHEAELSTSTDVAHRPEFADRLDTRTLDGREVSGWFVDDFSLEELKRLYARERLATVRQQSAGYDCRFRVPTFAEITALAVQAGRRLGRRVGVYPELKHPTYFAERGLRHEDALLTGLEIAGLGRADVFIQCFEPSALRRLAVRTSVPLVQRVDVAGQPYDWEHHGHGGTFAGMLAPGGLKEISAYAAAVGVHKSLVIPRDPDGRLARPSGLVEQVHKAGMAVHAWTFRNESAFLPADLRHGSDAGAFGDAIGEYYAFFAAGVDAVLSDHPDTATAARQIFAGPAVRHRNSAAGP
ncbi:glycerophosphodiester phosphodiesterase [Phytoactinopolyspora alkaliphila]|uniref:glycerophosphodiester phosphodiesterase n=1 Tax=Phytoactinopolyspora alkaliphila TaxID=1783498 RepID=A0A6N9YJS0_9ACTN|nr:glycerophosphodiester phosphodiesterase family protein [Phytoactinopolyspora alkaliphila]NED95129.1 glycerophosphodiester phosphodiesterase [Phytoactinopolyspora alkaliphila]